MKRAFAGLVGIILLGLTLHSLHHAWEGVGSGLGSKEPPCPVCQQAGGMAPPGPGCRIPSPPPERGMSLWDVKAPVPVDPVSDDRTARGPPSLPA
jgi:hypothetical protein